MCSYLKFPDDFTAEDSNMTGSLLQRVSIATVANSRRSSLHEKLCRPSSQPSIRRQSASVSRSEARCALKSVPESIPLSLVAKLPKIDNPSSNLGGGELCEDDTQHQTIPIKPVMNSTDLAKLRTEFAQERTRFAEERTSFAQQRTGFASYRTILAEERTSLAWMKGGAGMLSFSVLWFKLSDVLHERKHEGAFIFETMVVLVANVMAIYCCLQAKHMSENSLVILENDFTKRAKQSMQQRVRVIWGLLLTSVSLLCFVLYGVGHEVIEVLRRAITGMK